MTAPRTPFAIRALHWTVGLVVLLESCRTFLGAHAGLHSAGHAGALASVRLALSGGEIVAVLLFLVPVTTLVGGYALLAIFALAIAIHGLTESFGDWSFWCCMGRPCSLAWRTGVIGRSCLGLLGKSKALNRRGQKVLTTESQRPRVSPQS